MRPLFSSLGPKDSFTPLNGSGVKEFVDKLVFSDKVLPGPLLQAERSKNRQQVPCWRRAGACSQHGLRVEVRPGVGLEGRLRWFAHLLGHGVCRMNAQYPAFAPGSSKVAFGIFGLFVSFVQNLSQLHTHAFISVPYSFFVFCCLRRGVSRCKHCSPLAKGSGSRSVSFPPRDSTPLFFFYNLNNALFIRKI